MLFPPSPAPEGSTALGNPHQSPLRQSTGSRATDGDRRASTSAPPPASAPPRPLPGAARAPQAPPTAAGPAPAGRHAPAGEVRAGRAGAPDLTANGCGVSSPPPGLTDGTELLAGRRGCSLSLLHKARSASSPPPPAAVARDFGSCLRRWPSAGSVAPARRAAAERRPGTRSLGGRRGRTGRADALGLCPRCL